MKNYFLEIFTESFLYLVLTNYLKIKDIKNLSNVSKKYLKNEMNLQMKNYVIKQKSSYIIYRFISNSCKTFRNLINL